MTEPKIVIIGGGASGVFAAIQAARANPRCHVTLLEGTRRLLTKVKISGGGRCNVTHNLFDLRKFAENYPRGHREMLSVLNHFGPTDTIAFFKSIGIELHAEADGRMFPQTNSSQTIIDGLCRQLQILGVDVRKGVLVSGVEQIDDSFQIYNKGETLTCQKVLVATGSMPIGYKIARSFGHKIDDLVPSLFTFQMKEPLIEGLSGTSFADVCLDLRVGKKSFKGRGPMLITHWGLSGPAVLRLSAFAAQEFFAANYEGELFLDFVPKVSRDELQEYFQREKERNPKRMVSNIGQEWFSKNMWKKIVEQQQLGKAFQHVSKADINAFVEKLKRYPMKITGKGEFKEEFVTCGGVNLKEINMKTMESKRQPGLYFAGELINVDGVTGGFNFQNAWATGFLAGKYMAL